MFQLLEEQICIWLLYWLFLESLFNVIILYITKTKLKENTKTSEKARKN